MNTVPHLTQEQRDRLDLLRDRLEACEVTPKDVKSVPSFEEWFESAAPKGGRGFEWKSPEAGDWHVSDKSLIAYAVDMGRRPDGTRWVEVSSVDASGNWDTEGGYDEQDLLGATEEEKAQAWDELYRYDLSEWANFWRFFAGWADYWLDAAEDGKDPCKQALVPLTVDLCLDWAEENLKSAEETAQRIRGE
jgi:hypothetical protein